MQTPGVVQRYVYRHLKIINVLKLSQYLLCRGAGERYTRFDWSEVPGQPGWEVDDAGKPPHFPLETQTLVVATFSNQQRA